MGSGLSILSSVLLLFWAAQQNGFTGVWERNVDESDDPRAIMERAMSQMRGQGDGGRPPRGGGGQRGGGPPGRGGQPGGGPSGDGRARPDLGNVPDEMTVELEDGELLVDDGEQLRIYYLDAEKHKREMPNGTELETVAEQKGNAVRIEEKMERGQIDRKYELSPDGETMIVTVTIKLGRMKAPAIIKTVYERGSHSSG